jgi:hypothetical protein|tara:strand:+ start:282 stop:557 length:276 start_codon:yes stop_codon:yes gene_type:complete
MDLTSNQVVRFQTLIQALTLFTLLVGTASVFVMIGRRDATIEHSQERVNELWDITQELVKSQVLSVANDGDHERQLDELKARVHKLENRRD